MNVVAEPPIEPSPSDLGSLTITKNTEIIPLKICNIKMMPVIDNMIANFGTQSVLLSYMVTDSTKLKLTSASGDTMPILMAISETVPDLEAVATPSRRWKDTGILPTQKHVLDDACVRELLDHQDTMTETLRLKVNGGKSIEVDKILGPFDDEERSIRTRVVVLRDQESKKILSLGLIKIDLNNLSADFEKDLRESYIPFGELLKKHKVGVQGNVQQFYKISTPDQKREKFFFLTKPDEQEAFRFRDKTDIFGRYNVLTRTDNGKRLARVYEFLAADSKIQKSE